MHWKESGIHIYSWGTRVPPFFSIDIYTCKDFEEKSVIDFSKDFFSDNLIELSCGN
jgi:S-adenosylmethionine decarboxylase